MTRADAHNNPTAFTTDIAQEAGLMQPVDFTKGSSFVSGGRVLYTAILPSARALAITIQVIDKISFYTHTGQQRWSYIALPQFVWLEMSFVEKRRVIGFMYLHEGGTELSAMFSGTGTTSNGGFPNVP